MGSNWPTASVPNGTVRLDAAWKLFQVPPYDEKYASRRSLDIWPDQWQSSHMVRITERLAEAVRDAELRTVISSEELKAAIVDFEQREAERKVTEPDPKTLLLWRTGPGKPIPSPPGETLALLEVILWALVKAPEYELRNRQPNGAPPVRMVLKLVPTDEALSQARTRCPGFLDPLIAPLSANGMQGPAIVESPAKPETLGDDDDWPSEEALVQETRRRYFEHENEDGTLVFSAAKGTAERWIQGQTIAGRKTVRKTARRIVEAAWKA